MYDREGDIPTDGWKVGVVCFEIGESVLVWYWKAGWLFGGAERILRFL